MVIDTHCHLNDEMFSDDYEDIILSMKDDNLDKLIVCGSDYETSKKAIEIATKYKDVYAIIGNHPENCNFYDESIEKYYETQSQLEKVVAIGEIGLDYHYGKENREKQIEILIKQLELAYKVKLPVCIHLRDAYDDFLQIIESHKDLLKYSGVIHCYSGSLDYAKIMIKYGFKLGIDGPLTFKNNKRAVEVVENLPLENFVVETDCPYLSPEPVRGTRNQPKNVNYIVSKIASIKNMDICKAEEILLNNSYELYKKMKR